MNEQKNSIGIPGAIIIAGLLIAGGIFFSGKPALNLPDVKNIVSNKDIILKPVSENDHIRGNPNAPITLIEFSDPECPFCKMFQTTMNEVMDTYGKDGKIAWVYRHYPIDQLHPKARKEVEAIECVSELGGNTAVWKMLDTLYANTPANNGLDFTKLPDFAKTSGVDVTKFNTCLSSGKYAAFVATSIEEALDAGARGTPYSVMVAKNPLTSAMKDQIEQYVVTNRIFDQEGNPLVYVISDTRVVVSGALYAEMIKALADIILQK